MRVVFSPEARQEFEEAERYYERQVPGLGARSRTEVRSARAFQRHWLDAKLVELRLQISGLLH